MFAIIFSLFNKRKKLNVDRVGKQNYKVIDTNEKWILYHNCFSLCSRKVRLCLEELEIEYKQEHIDLIETGKYRSSF